MNANAARRFFLARLFAMLNAFLWGTLFVTWTDSAFPLLARQIWCVTFGFGISIGLEVYLFVKKLEFATAIDSISHAHTALVDALEAVADVSRKLEGGHPPRNVNPECWRN